MLIRADVSASGFLLKIDLPASPKSTELALSRGAVKGNFHGSLCRRVGMGVSGSSLSVSGPVLRAGQ